MIDFRFHLKLRYSLPFTKLQCQWETHPARKYGPYPPCTRLTLRTSVWGSECASNTREEPKEASNDSFEVDNVAFGEGWGVPCNNVTFFFLSSFSWATHPLIDVHTSKGASIGYWKEQSPLHLLVAFVTIPSRPSQVAWATPQGAFVWNPIIHKEGLHDPNIALSHTDHGPFIVGWWTSSKLTDTYLVWGQVALTVPETTTKSYGSPTHA